MEHLTESCQTFMINIDSFPRIFRNIKLYNKYLVNISTNPSREKSNLFKLCYFNECIYSIYIVICALRILL